MTLVGGSSGADDLDVQPQQPLLPHQLPRLGGVHHPGTGNRFDRSADRSTITLKDHPSLIIVHRAVKQLGDIAVFGFDLHT